MGFDVKLDTNGSNPHMLQKLIDEKLIDYVAMDIKSSIENYSSICGVTVNADNIQQSINILKNSNIDYEFRTTVSPDLTLDDLLKISNLIKGAPIYYLQQYIPPNSTFPEPHSLEFLNNAVIRCNQITNTKLR